MAKYFLRKLMTVIAVLGTAFTAAVPADAALMQSKNTRVYANWHENKNDKQLSAAEHDFYNYALKQLKTINNKGGKTIIKYDLSKYNLSYDEKLKSTGKVISLLKDNSILHQKRE